MRSFMGILLTLFEMVFIYTLLFMMSLWVSKVVCLSSESGREWMKIKATFVSCVWEVYAMINESVMVYPI